MDKYSQDEKIELFKEGLNQLLNNSELSVSILYPILNTYLMDIKTMYENYRLQIIQSINNKQEKEEKAE